MNKSLIREKIKKETSRFSFIQVVRLLRFLTGKDISISDFIKNHLRITPKLSLGFPGTDIVSMSEDEEKIKVVATFLGIYGPSSPLPTFYTEDLIDEYMDGSSVKKDFLDIFNILFFELFFAAISKYQLIYKLADDGSSEYENRIYSLMGLGSEKIRDFIPERENLIKYTGIFLHRSKSASGLESLIRDYFSLEKVKIEEFIKRTIDIDESQRCFLGIKNSKLGENSHIGSRKTDYSGKVAVDLGPMSTSQFHSFLPSGKNFKTLSNIVSFYLDRPVDVEIRIEARKEGLTSTKLGSGRFAELGYNSWIFSDIAQKNRFKASFNLPSGLS